MKNHDPNSAVLTPDTKVLFRIRNTQEFLMTNDNTSNPYLFRVFSANINGKITGEGLLLGSIISHDPEFIYELEKFECRYGDLATVCSPYEAVVSGLIGLSVGDAFGVPFEFLSREEVGKIKLYNMLGKDCPHKFQSRWGNLIPKGAWSDDTSMTIAAMSSIIHNHGIIDYDDIMQQFLLWWEHGYYTSLEFPFGLGRNISFALNRFKDGVPALECGGKGIRDNGNGALMRMFPFAMYCIMKGCNDDETLDLIKKAAGITHGHEINVLSCYIYTQFLYECMRTKNPDLAYRNVVIQGKYKYPAKFSQETMQALDAVFRMGACKGFDTDGIQETGYVVNSLLIAIYSILHTDNYEDSIKTAVSFGYDTDTNAAITGSVSGALYGMDGIPKRWLNDLRKKNELVSIGKQFADCIMLNQ